MNLFSPILAVNDELVYVIAVLILSVAGAVFDKIKRNMADREDSQPGVDPPVRPELQMPRAPDSEPTRREPQRSPQKPQADRIPPPVPGRRPATQLPPVATPGRPQSPRTRPPLVKAPQPRVEKDRAPSKPSAAVTTPAPRERVKSPAAELIIEAMRVAKPAEIKEISMISAPVPKVSAHPAQAFRRMNVADWRRAMVLTEVLGPPLALRQSEPPT